MYMRKKKKQQRKKPAAPGLTATGIMSCLNLWHLVAPGELLYHENAKAALSTAPWFWPKGHLTGTSGNPLLSPDFITLLANDITSSCFNPPCWKGITIANCFVECFENWSWREIWTSIWLHFCLELFRYTSGVWTRWAACPVSMGEVLFQVNKPAQTAGEAEQGSVLKCR